MIKTKDKNIVELNNEDTQTTWIESTDTLTIQTYRSKKAGCTIDIPGGYQLITTGNGKTENIKLTTYLDAFINRTGPITVKGMAS